MALTIYAVTTGNALAGTNWITTARARRGPRHVLPGDVAGTVLGRSQGAQPSAAGTAPRWQG
jgi:hypothetical protein